MCVRWAPVVNSLSRLVTTVHIHILEYRSHISTYVSRIHPLTVLLEAETTKILPYRIHLI